MKRNHYENKKYKEMLKALDGYLGEKDAGMFIAIVLDCFEKLLGKEDERELRTLEIKLNDFFSVKYDFESEKIVEE